MVHKRVEESGATRVPTMVFGLEITGSDVMRLLKELGRLGFNSDTCGAVSSTQTTHLFNNKKTHTSLCSKKGAGSGFEI